MIWHLIRDPLGMNDPKEGAAGTMGEKSPGNPCQQEGRRLQSQISQAQPSVRGKWRNACRLVVTNGL